MNKIASVGMLGILLGVVAGSAAHAQSLDKVQNPLSIKLGVYSASSGSARDAIGSTAFTGGLDYAFSKSAEEAPTLYSAYLDYAGGSKNGNNASLVGLGVGARQYVNKATNTTVAPYYGAGVGVYYLTAKPNGGDSKNSTQIGGKVLAGVEFNSGPFVEVGYTLLSSKVYDTHFDGFNVDIGTRF